MCILYLCIKTYLNSRGILIESNLIILIDYNGTGPSPNISQYDADKGDRVMTVLFYVMNKKIR
jgi:hypothetical protein